MGKACKACGATAEQNASQRPPPVQRPKATGSNQHQKYPPVSRQPTASERGQITPQVKPLWKRLLFIGAVLFGGHYLYIQHLAPIAQDHLMLTSEAGYNGWLSISMFILSLPYAENNSFHLRSLPRYIIGVFFSTTFCSLIIHLWRLC